MKTRRSFPQLIFEIVNTAIMLLLCIICIIPLWHVIMASISEPAQVDMATGFILRPLGSVSTKAYSLIMKYRGIWTGYGNTIFYVVAQCIITSFLSVIAGYVLSRKRFRYRGVLMGMITFTMLFNGGMIPTYMVVRNLGMLDQYSALLIPSALQVFYIIIMRTAIEGIPDSLEESARIDGAGEMTIMWKIILPLCKATFAVIILFVAVGKWNEWFTALLYLPTAKDKYPLQMFLREILIQSTTVSNAADAMDNAALYKTLAKYASIVVTTLPILCIYPFVQKHFVNGVMVGSVKG
ncbi:MAG TPA: carbohydrate ABC transporter permease [Clostridiales bacterium]|nr:carbohydrate ABC transporter permease [Clostridiales bacterium]